MREKRQEENQSREEKRRIKRERILAEAGKLFVANGIESTKIIDIARAADVAKGTVYEYFDSKEDIAAEWIRCMFADFHAEMDVRLSSSQGFKEKLKCYVEYHLEQMTGAILNARVLLTDSRSRDPIGGHCIDEAFEKIYEDRIAEIVIENVKFEIDSLKKIFADACGTGELRQDIDTNLASFMLMSMMPFLGISKQPFINPGLLTDKFGIEGLEWTVDDLISYIIEGIGSTVAV